MNVVALLLLAAITMAQAEPAPTPPRHPSFQLDAQAKRALVEKALTIKPGDSYESVIGKLGAPTHDQLLAHKENDRVVGRILKYYAVIWEEGLVNELHDELVDVFFDPQDHVRSVDIRVKLNP